MRALRHLTKHDMSKFFNKYLQVRLKRSWPIGISLKGLLDKILTDPRWDLKFIGMQVVIEGLALARFSSKS